RYSLLEHRAGDESEARENSGAQIISADRYFRAPMLNPGKRHEHQSREQRARTDEGHRSDMAHRGLLKQERETPDRRAGEQEKIGADTVHVGIFKGDRGRLRGAWF